MKIQLKEEEVWETDEEEEEETVIPQRDGAGVIDGDTAVVIYHTVLNTPPV